MPNFILSREGKSVITEDDPLWAIANEDLAAANEDLTETDTWQDIYTSSSAYREILEKI